MKSNARCGIYNYVVETMKYKCQPPINRCIDNTNKQSGLAVFNNNVNTNVIGYINM